MEENRRVRKRDRYKRLITVGEALDSCGTGTMR